MFSASCFESLYFPKGKNELSSSCNMYMIKFGMHLLFNSSPSPDLGFFNARFATALGWIVNSL